MMSSTMKSTHRQVSSVRAMLLPLGFILGILSLALSPASAQDDNAQKKATEYYKQGTTQFKLGNFDKAIEYFKLAYETSPHHAFLFNLGQAYRQQGDCKQAIFFYKGYLAEAGDKAKNRPLVEQHIKELTEICDATEDSKNKPPDGALSPTDDNQGGDKGGDTAASDRVATADTGAENNVSTSTRTHDDGGEIHAALTPWQPSLLSASLAVGPALVGFGGVDAGAQPSIGISAGYPLSFGKIGLTVGAVFTYTPVPWEVDGVQGTSTLASALVNVGVRYWVMDKLAVGMDVGGGGLFLTGLQEGDLFLMPGSEVSGVLSMPNFRAGLAADYLLSNNLMISAAPLIYSLSPAIDGLRPEIESFTRIEFMVGVGYRM